VTFGDVDGSWDDSHAPSSPTTLRELTTEVLTAARDQGISPRAAAQAKVDANLAALHADDQ
jgi:glutamate dehydrogenase (NAD(P)+)